MDSVCSGFAGVSLTLRAPGKAFLGLETWYPVPRPQEDGSHRPAWDLGRRHSPSGHAGLLHAACSDAPASQHLEQRLTPST